MTRPGIRHAARHQTAGLLLGVAVIGLLDALPGAGAAGEPPAAPAASAPNRLGGTLARLEDELLDLVNRHRTARGLSALTADPRISEQARRHSAAMASGATPFGHDGFAQRVAALRHFVPCRSSAENVASILGHDRPAREIVRGWLASPGHRKNIEGPYDVSGVGVARSAGGKLYVTQIFVGR